MAQLIFPESLKEESPYPTIRFAVKNIPVPVSIHLPVPPGITFNDGMNYSSIDLGLIGNEAVKAVEQFSKEGAGAGFGSFTSGMMDKLKSMNGAAAAVIASNLLATESTTQRVGLGVKKILPPNTNSIFQGSTIRQFGFQFKLVARTKYEARTAKAIVDVFRTYMYPEGTNLLLSYPNTWSITFSKADLPEIKECYLTSLTTSYNNSTNIFYSDDSPLETDISLTFQETKALVRSDLYKDTFQTARGDGSL